MFPWEHILSWIGLNKGGRKPFSVFRFKQQINQTIKDRRVNDLRIFLWILDTELNGVFLFFVLVLFCVRCGGGGYGGPGDAFPQSRKSSGKATGQNMKEKLPPGPPNPHPGPLKAKQNERQNTAKRKTPYTVWHGESDVQVRIERSLLLDGQN